MGQLFRILKMIAGLDLALVEEIIQRIKELVSLIGRLFKFSGSK